MSEFDVSYRAQERAEVIALDEALIPLFDELQRSEDRIKEAEAEEKRLRALYADALAAKLGVTLGSIIVHRKNKPGTGISSVPAVLVESRYLVTHYRMCGGTGLFLSGRKIRKDGTPGEIVDIGPFWGETPA